MMKLSNKLELDTLLLVRSFEKKKNACITPLPQIIQKETPLKFVMQVSYKLESDTFLLDISWLPIYLKLSSFPVIENIFSTICSLKYYPFLEKGRLKTELMVLYE